MDLRSDQPFWLIDSGPMYQYPTLSQDLTVDVVVIGGGITGSLIAHALSNTNMNTIVVDKRIIGLGSTCA
ncbi:MAG TPA: FAD-dependent oxidoreductase, partial [Cytophagales bacterium]|nr:FAD-dependent oxidoreductase [Cytophagales bacterium]